MYIIMFLWWITGFIMILGHHLHIRKSIGSLAIFIAILLGVFGPLVVFTFTDLSNEDFHG